MNSKNTIKPMHWLIIALLNTVVISEAQTTRQSRAPVPRPAGASTRPSDSNKRSHANFFQGCVQRVEETKGKTVDIIFIGDSITANWTEQPTPRWDEVGKAIWDTHYANRNALNFGVGADRTEHVLWRLQNMDIGEFHPKVAVILIGTNNNIDTSENIAAGVKAVVDKTRKVFKNPRVILISILPNKRAGDLMAKTNPMLEKLCDGKDVVWFDLASKMTPQASGWKGIGKDNLHLSPEGYELWATEMEPVLTKLLNQK